MLRRFFHVFTALACSSILAACAGNQHLSPTVPSSQMHNQLRADDKVGSRVSSSSDPKSFASESGKDIADADIERFIDPSVTGKDRVLAHQLLAFMPKNFRGDFVYVRSDGTILSNRPSFAAGMVKEPLTVSLARPSFAKQRTSSTRHPDAAYPPTLNDGSGPYIREYSVQGVTAFYGYVDVGCSDSHFNYNSYGYLDVGYLYSGGWGETFSSIDAGFQYNSDTSIQPFIATNYAANAQWTNQAQHYGCNEQLMMEYGAAPAPSQQMFLGVGISSLDPTGATPPPNDTAIDAAYVFWDKPSDYYDPGTDMTGMNTVCRYCITKRMSGVGQKGGDSTFDGTCFGGCRGFGDWDISWTEMEMGQFTSCTNNPSSFVGCYMQYNTSNAWYGNIETQHAGNSSDISQTENINSAFEGFYLSDPPSISITPDATENYDCSWNDVEQKGSCGFGTPTDWSYSTPSTTLVDATHPISIQLNSMQNGGSCGNGLSYTVSLLNPSGNEVYNSGSLTALTFSTSYNSTSGTGAWKWVLHADDQHTSCGLNLSGGGEYDDEATGTGYTVYY